MNNPNWFGESGGWYFVRAKNGDVLIGRGQDFGTVKEVHRISSSQWCSVIAHVSAQGETGLTWELAKAFHMAGVNFCED